MNETEIPHRGGEREEERRRARYHTEEEEKRWTSVRDDHVIRGTWSPHGHRGGEVFEGRGLRFQP